MRKLLGFLVTVTLGLGIVDSVFAEYPQGMSARSIRKIERAQKKKRTNKRKKNNNKGKKDTTVVLSDVCKSVSPISALLKNAWPGHISRADPRSRGFALVCNRRDCPRKFPVTAYYSDGVQAFRLGYYGRWSGNGQPRAYCSAGGAGSCSATLVTKEAKKFDRDGKVYLVFDAAKKVCRTATPGKRNGSPF